MPLQASHTIQLLKTEQPASANKHFSTSMSIRFTFSSDRAGDHGGSVQHGLYRWCKSECMAWHKGVQGSQPSGSLCRYIQDSDILGLPEFILHIWDSPCKPDSVKTSMNYQKKCKSVKLFPPSASPFFCHVRMGQIFLTSILHLLESFILQDGSRGRYENAYTGSYRKKITYTFQGSCNECWCHRTIE